MKKTIIGRSGKGWAPLDQGRLKSMHWKLVNPLRLLNPDQRGITGLETAIVLIAFVVVASVFAFAVISTGLVSSEKAKDTALGAVKEASATLVLRGNVVATGNAGLTAVDNVKFTLGTGAQTGQYVELSKSAVIITYLDKDNFFNVAASDWSPTWLIGSGSGLDSGEQVSVTITLSGMSTLLGASKEFTIQVAPSRGAVLVINKTTPPEITKYMEIK